MQLPFSKQLITAALIAIVAPSATVIGAQSFSDFISKPHPVQIAQEGPPPGGQPGQPPGGGTFGPPPGNQPGQAPGSAGPTGFQPQTGVQQQPGSQPNTFGPPPGSQLGQTPGFGGPQGPPPGGQPGQGPGGQQDHPPGSQPGLLPGAFPPPFGGFRPEQGSQQFGSQTDPSSGSRPPVSGEQRGSPTSNTTQPTSARPGIQICPAMPVLDCPPGSESIFETNGDGCSIQKCVPKGSGDQPRPSGEWKCPNPPPGMKCEESGKYPNGCSRFKCERAEQPRQEGSSPPPALASCAQEVLGSEAYEQMIKGILQPTDEQKKLMHEKCSQFKREMPSSSGEFSGQQPGGGQGVGPEGPGGQKFGPGGSREQGFGPSEEDMERMEKEQKARMLKDMQRGLRGMEQGIRMMDRGLQACRKAKIDVADADSSLATIKDIVAKVRAATDPEDLPDLMSELPEHFEKLRETVENCSRVAQLPRILKQVNREIKQMEGDLRRLTSQVSRAKLDLADELSTIKMGIDTVKALVADIGKVRDAESFDAAMENLEGLQDTFQDLREKIEAIRGVLNIKSGVTQAQREIRQAERTITSLKRAGKNTAELEQLLIEAKALVAQIQGLSTQKPIDPEALSDAFEALEDVGHRAEALMSHLRGAKVDRGYSDDFQKSPVGDVKLPDVFKQFEKDGASEGPSEFESLLGF